MIWRRDCLAATLVVVAACGSPPPLTPLDPEAHRASIEQWRQERHADLSEADGWLSLVGLYWLEPGANRFGADPTGDLVYAGDPVPAVVGVFTVSDDAVSFVAAPGTDVRQGEEPVRAAIMHSAEPSRETVVLQAGTLRWHVLKRGDRIGVRLKDSTSPVLLAFEGIDNYPISLDWRIDGRFEPYDPPRSIKIPNVLGMLNETESPGAAAFEVAGQRVRLDLWRDSAGDVDYFTAFADTSNGTDTYGGGRFLRIDPPDEYGRIVVDFNRAYNPPCAFTTFATCPLPPEHNRLPVWVEAGERTFKPTR